MNLAELEPRLLKNRSKGLCIDTNLLLLYFVGQLDPRLIARSERTRVFDAKDFQLLKRLAAFFPKIVTTPGILTEVSNLAALDHKGGNRQRFFAEFSRGVHLLAEEHIPSREAASARPFARFGLTDSAIILTCKDQYLAVTTDAALADFNGTQSCRRGQFQSSSSPKLELIHPIPHLNALRPQISRGRPHGRRTTNFTASISTRRSCRSSGRIALRPRLRPGQRARTSTTRKARIISIS